MFIHNLIAVALTTALTAGAAYAESASSAVKGAVQNVKTELFDIMNKETVTVNFKDGSSVVDQGEVNDLKALLTSNKREGKIDSLIIAAWSDKDYPAGQGETLSDADRKLADQRADAVKKTLTSLGAGKVDSYSMAEHPSWIAKTFNTQDAKVKGEGAVKDADDNLTAQIGKQLKDKGGPGTVVVLVRREGDYSAH